MVTIDEESIPDRFKNRERWLLWDSDSNSPRNPHWRGDFGVSWSDPENHHSFEEALEAAQETESWGIGYVVCPEDDEVIIDIDRPYDDSGDPRDWFLGLSQFKTADTYMEWSPSGEFSGVHIAVEAEEPDWWKDSQLDEAEHQGIEVLSNSFCTFTGNKIEGAGESVAEYNPDGFLYNSYHKLRGESPRFNRTTSNPDSNNRDNDEWLTLGLVEQALESIDPDIGHSEWIKLAYAVNSFDDGLDSKRLFEDWSKKGDKWDQAAQRSIDHVWDHSRSGGITPATLVAQAKEAGWTPPSQSEDADTSESGVYDSDWNSVRLAYGEQGSGSGRKRAADLLESESDWMYVVDSQQLWVYDCEDGYFVSDGEERAKNILEEELAEYYSSYEASEIIERIQVRNQTSRAELNARTEDGELLCVGNGVVNLETGDLYDHSPDYKFTRGIQWDFDPGRADPDPILDFLDDVTKRECDRDTLLDHLAHGLMPGHPYRAFVIMYGPGSNGKTRVGKLFREFVGEENAASVELQDLTGSDDYATGPLPGVFINVGDDISVGEIRDSSILKSLTGDGTIRANEKYVKRHEFQSEAAMFFSANEPPRIREKTVAISDRLYPIEMPNRFVDNPSGPNEKKKIPGIAEKLVQNKDAMRGLLVLAVEHAQEVIERNGRYSMPEGPQERREIYEAASDPIKRFALEYFESAGEEDAIIKDDAYEVYNEMCSVQSERAVDADTFKRKITRLASIDLKADRIRSASSGSNRDNVWRRVQFVDAARNFMNSEQVVRYFDDSTSDRDRSSEEQTESTVTQLSSLTGLSKGFTDVTVQIAEKLDPPNWLEGKGHVLGGEEGVMTYICENATPLERVDPGDTVDLQNVKVEDRNSGLTLVLSQVTEVECRTSPDKQWDLADSVSAATDGGKETSQTSPPTNAGGTRADMERVVSVIDDAGCLTKEQVRNRCKQRYDLNIGRAGKMLERAKKQGLVEKLSDGEYRSI